MKLFAWHLVMVLGLLIAGCSGVQTYPNRVAAGETVAVATGWKHYFSRKNITATITPREGSVISIPSNQIRASINFYPDPLSSLVLSRNTGTDISSFSLTYSGLVNYIFTGGDNEWWQTIVFLDIPASVPTGAADITIFNPEGETVTTAVEVVAPASVVGGTPDQFNAELAGPLTDLHLTALERVDHYVVRFIGPVTPYALQIDLSHSNLTGYVVNTKGDVKSLSWSDQSGTYRVLVTPATPQGFGNMDDLKFYLAVVSGVQGAADLSVVPGSVLAFDRNGVAVAGVSASVELVRGAAGLN